MRIDSHQHFWIYGPLQYPWIQPDWPIRRDYLPKDLAPHLDHAGIGASIAVQARQTIEESRWLLDLAEDNPRIAGVVGWVDLRSERVAEELAALSMNPKFVGVRHVVQDEPDDSFMLKPDFLRGIAVLSAFDLTYDLLIYPRQLPAAIELARTFPRQPFVLDHIAKPPIREGRLQPWLDGIRELAALPNVWCKVSGMVTEAAWKSWKLSDYEEYLNAVFLEFGEERLMFGSDWPVCLLSAEYSEVFEIVRNQIARLSPDVQEQILGGNAARFYKLDG